MTPWAFHTNSAVFRMLGPAKNPGQRVRNSLSTPPATCSSIRFLCFFRSVFVYHIPPPWLLLRGCRSVARAAVRIRLPLVPWTRLVRFGVVCIRSCVLRRKRVVGVLIGVRVPALRPSSPPHSVGRTSIRTTVGLILGGAACLTTGTIQSCTPRSPTGRATITDIPASPSRCSVAASSRASPQTGIVLRKKT